MSKLSAIDRPTHWRQRAAEARSVADQLADPLAKKTMQDIALSYEQLATLAETKLPFEISK